MEDFKMTVDLNELYIGVRVNDYTTYFKDLTKATLFATEKINKGYEVKMLYCDQYGCKIQ